MKKIFIAICLLNYTTSLHSMKIRVNKKAFSIDSITKGLRLSPEYIFSYAFRICKLHNDEKFRFLFQKNVSGFFHCPDPSTTADAIAEILPQLKHRTQKKELKRLQNNIIANHRLLRN